MPRVQGKCCEGDVIFDKTRRISLGISFIGYLQLVDPVDATDAVVVGAGVLFELDGYVPAQALTLPVWVLVLPDQGEPLRDVLVLAGLVLGHLGGPEDVPGDHLVGVGLLCN